MMEKKIWIGSLLLSLFSMNTLMASEYMGYSSDESEKSTLSQTRIYEDGFHHGINCIEREFQLYGKSGDIVKFKKYMVLMSIASLSRESILIYKNYAYEEGLVPISIEPEKLVFKSFDRRADAEYLANKILNKKYMGGQNKVVIKLNNPNQEYRRGKFIYSEIFDRMRERMEKEVEGKVFITDGSYLASTTYSDTYYSQSYPTETLSSSTYYEEPLVEYTPPKPKSTVKKRPSKKKKKYFSINESKAELFRYDKKSKKMISAGFLDSGSKYIYKNVQKIGGVRYIKYKNLFIELDDVTRY